MKITREYLLDFEPCEDSWKNYLTHYSDFEGSLYDFLCLDKISVEDKHWVICQNHRCSKIQRIQRDYALICADRATFDSTKENKEFFLLCAFINVSEMVDLVDTNPFRLAGCAADWSAYSSALSSASWCPQRNAYYSSKHSANKSAHRSVEREIQIEIFKSLLEVCDE
jgi:hypothetical protein